MYLRRDELFPVPLSPVMSTVASVGATWATRARTASKRIGSAHHVRWAAEVLDGAPEIPDLGDQRAVLERPPKEE